MAFDDQIHRALQRTLGEMRGTIEQLFDALAQEIVGLLDAERKQIEADAADARRAVSAEIAAARLAAEVEVAEARDSAERVRRDADEQISAVRRQADEQVAAARSEVRAEIDLARSQAEAQVAQLREAAQRQVHDLRHTAEAQVADMKRTVEDVRQQAQQQLEALRRGTQEELDQVRRLAEAEIVSARRSANADAEELVVSQLAAAAADNDLRTREAVDRAVAAADAAALAGARRLAEAIESLDRARTLGESLDYLAQCAGREVERAAVFVCNGRLQGWRLVGFAPGAPSAKSIDLDFASAGIAGIAADTITAAARRAASQELPPFARDAGERDACALPVIVGGAVVAVLYADARAEASSMPDRWQAVLDILARHVGRSLEAMTVGQAAGLFLPRPMARASQPSRATPGGGMP